ncbi:hypothetical protein [uncultured Pseudacidovorax sp.]|uniref:hypothetical protein n=1 Tax=uncultured Pseudacidovorax sp. TaxID=679313 RepID=UPI0025FE55DF|nr:hypothetical protein [uncultured Pseudacidovorax sp.]
MTFTSGGKAASTSSAASIDARHLQDVLRRANDPVVARLLRDFIQEQDLRQSYPGAYLVALESIKRSQMRYARAKEQGQLVRSGLLRLGSLLKRGAGHFVVGVCWVARRCARGAGRRHVEGQPSPGRASNVLTLPAPGAAMQRSSVAQSGR